MIRCIGIGYFSTLDINFDYTKATDEVSVNAINAYTTDGLITSNRLSIEITDIYPEYYNSQTVYFAIRP